MSEIPVHWRCSLHSWLFGRFPLSPHGVTLAGGTRERSSSGGTSSEGRPRAAASLCCEVDPGQVRPEGHGHGGMALGMEIAHVKST